MKLHSTALVSDDLVHSLKIDLERASVCRFGIAYFSISGLSAIGKGLLARSLCGPDSFGVSSMSCACRYQPLISLSNAVAAAGGTPRLKYFMDPMVDGTDELDNLTLFHSKMVYLVNVDRSKSILYIGSHNWSRRALGPGIGSPRNAETTLRIEGDFDPEHLAGTGGSVFSDANLHLLNAFNSPLCLDANPANERRFEEWCQKGCKRARGEGLRDIKVILAIHRGSGQLRPSDWESLQNAGIYLQMLIEEEGQQVWNAGDRILVLVWDSEAHLQVGGQPHLLRCRISTGNAGPTSDLRGTNSSSSPIAGFRAVIWDRNQHHAAASGRSSGPRTVRTKREKDVNVFDFDFPTPSTDSSGVDGAVKPKYQFHLEVEQVIFPRDGELPPKPRYVWIRSSLALASEPKDAKIEEIPRYSVDKEKHDRMLESLREVFGVKLKNAKVLPFSGELPKRVGKKVVDHPLHDTFLDDTHQGSENKFYSDAKAGTLVPEIDEERITILRQKNIDQNEFFPAPMGRAQRVFTMRLDKLLETWEETAKAITDTQGQV